MTEKNGQTNSIVVEYFDERFYKRLKADGTTDYYPSVTTKLGVVEKPFLARWRGDVGNREADMRVFEASERGSRIHHAWYIINQGGVAIYNPPKRPNFTDADTADLMQQYEGKVVVVRYQDEMLDIWKLKRLTELMPFKVIASEATVYSDTYREAGTVDNVLKIEAGEYPVNGRKPLALAGGLYIADLKTGSAFDDNYYMQMASYANMWEETYGEKVAGTIGIHTGAKTKTGIPGLAIYHRNEEEWRADFKDFRAVSSVWEIKHREDRPQLFDFPALIKL